MAIPNKKSVIEGMNKSKPKFTVKRLVTLPLWKWADGVEKAFTCDDEIKLGRIVASKTKNNDGKEMEPASIMHVTDLETGAKCQLIVGAVLKSTLEENYPGNSYVGLSFTSTQSKVEGKRYRAYSLAEVELN
jgi:hypothetical protein